MGLSRRRIVLAVEPGILQGALAKMLSTGCADDDVVQFDVSKISAFHGRYDAAVVSDELPDGIEADVVITLPDTRGSGGTGTVTRGTLVEEVNISGAEAVIDLLDRYAPGG